MLNSCMAIPHGGWTFPSDGNLDSKAPLHEEPGYEELRQWLQGYRIANGKEVGDPTLDINLFIARQKEAPDQPLPFRPQVVQPRTLRDSVTNWLANLFQNYGTLSYIEEDAAEARAEICSTCPHNIYWKAGCPPCVENAERVELMLTQGTKTTFDEKLFGCDLCGHSNKVAVLLEKPHENLNVSLPDFCWLRKPL